ncbi:unnamed protein product [Caretta caretta]
MGRGMKALSLGTQRRGWSRTLVRSCQGQSPEPNARMLQCTGFCTASGGNPFQCRNLDLTFDGPVLHRTYGMALSGKQRSRELRPRAQEEPSTSLATEEPPASPEQEMGDSGMGTSSSADSRGASSPSVGPDSPEAEGSLCAETHSAQLEDVEEKDVSPEQASIRVIQQHLQGKDEWVQNRAKQLRFLHAVPSLCFSAQRQGRDTLEQHFSKAALMESIAELTEDLPLESKPSSTLSSSMATVRNLSKLKPPLALELESRLLRAVLYTIFTMGTGKDTTHFRTLDIMLRSMLTETPTKDKLQHLLEVSRLGGP